MEYEQESENEHDCLCSNDKALEYYVKYGRQRNLGRFLRIRTQSAHMHSHCALRMQDEAPQHCSTIQPTIQRLPLEVSDEEQQQQIEGINEANEDKENAVEVHEIPIEIETTSKHAEEGRKNDNNVKPTKHTRKTKNVNLQQSRKVSSSSSSGTNDSATLIRIVRESVEAELKRKHKTQNKATKSKYEEQAEADDDFCTPPKQTENCGTDKALTPESTAKSHRRLEWDSAADVGYQRRSMSSSNISVLERAVLHQLLKDNELNNATGQSRRLLEQILQQNYNAMTRAKSLDTPPLASSTHMEYKLKPSSLQEKSVQTTLLKTAKTTQQVQVNLPKPAKSDKSSDSKSSKHVEEHIADCKLNSDSDSTPEYHENSNVLVGETLLESTSTEGFISVTYTAQRNQEQTQGQALSSFSRSKSLEQESTSKNFHMNKSKSCENNSSPLSDNSNISGINRLADSSASLDYEQILQAKLMRRHSDSAMKPQAVSTSKSCDQLELGLDLLCALIEARSLSNSEKQRLLTNIVHRITSLYDKKLASYKAGTRTSETSSEVLSDAKNKRQKQQEENQEVNKPYSSPPTTSAAAAVKNKDMRRAIEEQNAYKTASEVLNEAKETMQQKENDKAHSSPPTTSAAAIKKKIRTRANEPKNSSESSELLSDAKDIRKQQLQQGKHEIIKPKSTATTTSVAAVKNKIQVEKPLEGVNIEHSENLQANPKNTTANSKRQKDIEVEYRNEKFALNSSPTEMQQKSANGSSSTSQEECCTPEWCQPMTLSEIEYERRKYEFAHNADKRRIVLEQPLSEFYKMNDEKREMLGNWLDMEISRLEHLRQVMLNQKITNSGSTDTRSGKKSETSNIKIPEVFYDQVVSDTPSTNSSKEVVVNNQENSTVDNAAENVIELIIEQSKENIFLKHNKFPKEHAAVTNNEFALRARNAQTFKSPKKVVPKQKPTAKKSTPPQSTSTALSTDIGLKLQHRSKMATPIDSISNSSESVTSFVKQKELPDKQTKQTLGTQTSIAIEHATQTVPQMQCTCNCSNFSTGIPPNNYYYPYHKCVQSNAASHCCQHCLCHQCRVTRYYTTPMTQANVTVKKPTTATKTTATSMTEMKKNASTQKPSLKTQSFQSSNSSSSSKLSGKSHTLSINAAKLSLTSSKTSTSTTLTGHISSDMSIHIDTHTNSTSSTTTTHQYDDLDSIEPSIMRQTVAVQTSSTLLHVQKPEVIGPGMQTAPIRIKPKSVAYVLEFHSIKGKPTRSSDEAYESMPEKILPLQAHLERKNSVFVTHTKQRNALLHRLHMLRLQRERELRAIVENNSFSSIERKLKNIPPPATDQVRLFTTKQMKAMTNKYARKLPEVLDREQRELEERRRRSNRLLRDLFNRRMQKRVRIGQISLSHSKCVI